jgi:hypothetical protein
MTKKRNTKLSSVKHSNRWSWENDVALLSWLDFSLKYKKDNFDATVVNYLDGAFTFEQIQRRLKTIWERRGPDKPGSPKHWHDIKIRGSISLHNDHGLNEAERNDIRLAVQKLEDFFSLEQLTPNRRLRSSSKVNTVSSSQDVRSNTPTKDNNGKAQGLKRKFGTNLLTSSGAKDENGQVDLYSSKASKGRKKPKTYSKRDVRVSSHCRVGVNMQQRTCNIRAKDCLPDMPPAVEEQRPRLQGKKSRSPTYIKDGEDGISDKLDGQPDSLNYNREESNPFKSLGIEGSSTSQSSDKDCDEKRVRCSCGVNEKVYGDVNELIECNWCKLPQHTGCLKHFCTDCTAAKDTLSVPLTRSISSKMDSSTETDDLIDPRLYSAIIQIQELQENLAAKESELQESRQFVEDLNRDIHYLNMAKKERDMQHGSSIEEQISKQQKQVHDLLNELKYRRRLGTFTKLTRSSDYRGTTTDIKIAFREAYHDSCMIFRNLEIKEFPFNPQLRRHEPLLALAQLVAGPKLDSAHQAQERQILSVDPVVLLRSFTNAALKEWVFETDFPNFEDDSSITLEAYRDLLATQGNNTVGALQLRELEANA